jgi:hypothetical protein
MWFALAYAHLPANCTARAPPRHLLLCMVGCMRVCRQLGNGHPRAVADSISHEVGHTFGLAHFGGSGSAPYNDGLGPWGPLLGLPYGRVLSQWNQGTAITGSLQDDLQLIAQQLPMLADEHGDTPHTATPLCQQPGQVSAGVKAARVVGVIASGAVCKQVQDTPAKEDSSGQQVHLTKAAVRGIISNSTDQDWFSVSVGRPGLLRVVLQLPSSAAGYGVNNLLAAVVIQTQDGVELAAARPVTGSEVSLAASADVQVAGGCRGHMHGTTCSEFACCKLCGWSPVCVSFQRTWPCFATLVWPEWQSGHHAIDCNTCNASFLAGTFFVGIIPNGVSGVSSYGSLGDYHLTVTFPSLPPPTPAATPTAQLAMQQPTAAHAGPGVATGSSSSQGELVELVELVSWPSLAAVCTAITLEIGFLHCHQIHPGLCFYACEPAVAPTNTGCACMCVFVPVHGGCRLPGLCVCSKQGLGGQANHDACACRRQCSSKRGRNCS